MGNAISLAIARAPRLWPLLRGPMRGFFDRVAPGWDERVEPDSPEHLAALEAAVERIGASPQQVLDVGTGTGAAALMLARRYPEAEVIGIDLSEQMIEGARAKVPPELRGRVTFSVGDASSLRYASNHFDLVVQVSAPVFFDELARVVAPGGHVVIASSIGPRTPCYTPDRVLRRGFERRGLGEVASGKAGPGTYFIARRA